MSSIQSNSTPAPSASPTAPPRRHPRMRSALVSGGGGIRTLVRGLTPETVFETAAFNHSATPPKEATSSPGPGSEAARETSAMRGPYEQGLHELRDGLYAYLQPDGTSGWSNAGLITADAASLLVDPLFAL